jgi:hypothetical protein
MGHQFHRVAVGWRDPQGSDPAEIIESQVYSVACYGQTNALRAAADEIERGTHPALPPTAQIASVTFLTPTEAREIAEMTAS